MDTQTNTFMGLSFKWFVGIVEDINDPLRVGRVRVRIIGHHTADKGNIPTSALPWAMVMAPINSAGMSGIGQTPFGILQGSTVVGFFQDGDHSQMPIIMGTIFGDIADEPDYGQGFSDPSQTYPRYNKTTERGTYPVTTDINPSALNDMKQYSVHSWLDATRITKIQKAWPFETLEEPASAWNPSYAQNHVRESQSGHIEEWDDSPGAERMMKMHRTGTYETVLPDGSTVVRILGDRYEIVLKDNNLAVNGDLNIVVQGNATLITNGDVEHRVAGDYNIAVDGDYNVTVKGDSSHFTDGDYNVSSTGTSNHFATGDYNVSSTGSSSHFSTGDYSVNSLGAGNIQAEETMFLSSEGILTTFSAATNFVSGTTVRLGSPAAPPIPPIPPISPITDPIISRRTVIPPDLIDGPTAEDILAEMNTGDITDRVTFKVPAKY